MTRAELIKALESLEGPSKELDAAIVRTLGHATAQAPNADHFVYRRYDDAGYNWNRVPPYTSSIDSALTLVPEGAHYGLRAPANGDLCVAWVRHPPHHPVWRAKTPAIALCIACLRAGGAE